MKSRDDKLIEKEAEIEQLDKKNKSLKDTIQKLSVNKQAATDEKQSQKSSQPNLLETHVPAKPSEEVLKELQFVAPILALNLKISDRI